jgi:hypothetical protein
MSSGLECEFFEPSPGVWYYALQDGSCPHDYNDWRDFATAYGPFSSQDEANQHLRDNHCNPGGSYSTDFSDMSRMKDKKVYEVLVKECAEREERRKKEARNHSYHGFRRAY